MSTRKLRKSIGIILPNVVNQFHEGFLDSFTLACKERDYSTTISLSNNDVDTECNYLKLLTKNNDALIVISCAKNYNEISSCVPKQIPVIFLFNQPADCPYTCILESDYSAIYQGVISCSNRGFSKIAYITSELSSSFSEDCLKAFKDALNSITPNSYNDDNIFEILNPSKENPQKLLNKLVENGYKAIFAASPSITKLLVDTLMIYNAKATEETSIVLLGYGTPANLLSSQLYVDIILQPTDEIIALAIQQVFYQIAHPKENADKKFLLKGKLRMHKISGWLNN